MRIIQVYRVKEFVFVTREEVTMVNGKLFVFSALDIEEYPNETEAAMAVLLYTILGV